MSIDHEQTKLIFENWNNFVKTETYINEAPIFGGAAASARSGLTKPPFQIFGSGTKGPIAGAEDYNAVIRAIWRNANDGVVPERVEDILKKLRKIQQDGKAVQVRDLPDVPTNWKDYLTSSGGASKSAAKAAMDQPPPIPYDYQQANKLRRYQDKLAAQRAEREAIIAAQRRAGLVFSPTEPARRARSPEAYKVQTAEELDPALQEFYASNPFNKPDDVPPVVFDASNQPNLEGAEEVVSQGEEALGAFAETGMAACDDVAAQAGLGSKAARALSAPYRALGPKARKTFTVGLYTILGGGASYGAFTLGRLYNESNKNVKKISDAAQQAEALKYEAEQLQQRLEIAQAATEPSPINIQKLKKSLEEAVQSYESKIQEIGQGTKAQAELGLRARKILKQLDKALRVEARGRAGVDDGRSRRKIDVTAPPKARKPKIKVRKRSERQAISDRFGGF